MFLTCFSCCLEQLGPVKSSRNTVGSFKNTTYRKSAKINPRSVFWWISGALWVRFFTILTLFCEKSASENGSEKWCPPRVKRGPLPGPGGSRTAPLACALFQTRNNNYSNNCRFSERIAEVVDTCQFFAEVVVPCLFHFRNLCLIVAFETWLLSRLLFSSNLCDSLPTSKTKQSKDTQNADDLTRPGPRPGELVRIS